MDRGRLIGRLVVLYLLYVNASKLRSIRIADVLPRVNKEMFSNWNWIANGFMIEFMIEMRSESRISVDSTLYKLFWAIVWLGIIDISCDVPIVSFYIIALVFVEEVD